ncbi:putative N6-adenine-specific DNA methylase (plasmid) [Chamaesiphon minutus PCC 6605]|uniref:site-specific DNA-methyltransferase (adenine-specific) n=2 Tax=Chamaesiphon TaxID=217161 RepID=K9UQN9_CHAP6|nr:putative N6-adenine-specific DNA methylase [Chamaesiphon minutus PCC 6605]
MSYLTPEAKSKLSATIRSLRQRLLEDLQNAGEGTFRLSIKAANQAGLTEANRVKRQRLEQWVEMQVRGETAGKKLKEEQRQKIAERQLRSLEKLAAATLLNRLVVIKQMEAMGLSKPAVVTGGWQSPAYREFREFAPDLCKDETEGYGTLLQLLWDELALAMPGLFGQVSLTSLLPIPAGTLRAVVEALDAPELKEIWQDDTTLGWVYQYWNDPEREGLDAKLNAGGKVEPHEIASKTQMFTERYMVEWLLQNSLGQLWLAMCQKNGWVAEAEADGTLARLEARRQVWRERRAAGEVSLDELMPIETEQEQQWKYWVQQPLTAAAVKFAPGSLRELKLLDPACGSGHFLVIAVGLLFALYREEGRHLGEDRSNRQIVESILEHNLYGIDIDPRAVQIAAAALDLKAKSLCPDASPKLLNLVASNLQVAALLEEDPMLVELRQEILAATGIPEDLTNRIVQALKGADRWGSLLKVDKAVDLAVQDYGRTIFPPAQGNLFNPVVVQPEFNFEQAKASVLEKLEQFLGRCTRGDDLGLRLRGEQLTAGVRFIRMVQENSYDLVVGNPPYQGTSKMSDSSYLEQHYPKGNADLYAVFLERGLQLAKQGGISALLTMRNWMFIKQFSSIREFLIDKYDLRLLGDFDRGAFDEVPNEVLAVTLSVFQKLAPTLEVSIALQPTPLDELAYDRQRTNRKRSAVLAQVGKFEFKSDRFTAIKEKPIVYWWDEEFLDKYAATSKIGDETTVRAGMQTSNNIRYLRLAWEIDLSNVYLRKDSQSYEGESLNKWVPYVKGAAGKRWFEPLSDVILWENSALEKQVMFDFLGSKGGGNGTPSRHLYFHSGISYSTIGANFSARIRRFRSVFDISGASVFPKNPIESTVLLNSKVAKDILIALNPTVNFQTSDIERLPLFYIDSSDEIFTKLDLTFTEHEAARETSVEFRQPGTSGWNYAQAWAQQSVDRPSGTPLPDWNPDYEQPPATNWVSYALGIALGRFGANGEGILTKTPETALPHGILYLSAYSGDRPESKDNLTHPACQPLITAWQQHGSSIATAKLRDWLRLNFFKDIHVKMYEQRPIYFPLSSANKNFVAYISIHRWTDTTLTNLLAEYLFPELRQLEGELSDLMDSRNQGDKKQQNQAEDRYSKISQLATELKTFADLVQQVAEQGAPPAEPSDPPRETDARFSLDLDDGVMVNSAALWPLLAPQGWKKPKTWWSELCIAQSKGNKDYDWSHLAARYFPQRVAAKCQIDPSLAVAHGCFWHYHPAKAYEWELRLQDEIASDFTIDELDSERLRQQFESDYPDKVKELQEKEAKRRDKKRKKADDTEDLGPLFEAAAEAGDE